MKKKRKIRAITPLKIIQGNRGRFRRYQSKARMRLLLLINSNWHPISYRFGVIAAVVQILDTLRLPPFGDLMATYDDHLMLIEKHVEDFLLVLIELFSLDVMAEALQANIG